MSWNGNIRHMGPRQETLDSAQGSEHSAEGRREQPTELTLDHRGTQTDRVLTFVAGT